MVSNRCVEPLPTLGAASIWNLNPASDSTDSIQAINSYSDILFSRNINKYSIQINSLCKSISYTAYAQSPAGFRWNNKNRVIYYVLILKDFYASIYSIRYKRSIWLSTTISTIKIILLSNDLTSGGSGVHISWWSCAYVSCPNKLFIKHFMGCSPWFLSWFVCLKLEKFKQFITDPLCQLVKIIT